MQVYAIDLLGQGSSEKAVLDYSIELWSNQIAAFAREIVGSPAVLIGNSIGSLISLAAAHDAGPDAVKAIVLLNCAGVLPKLNRL